MVQARVHIQHDAVPDAHGRPVRLERGRPRRQQLFILTAGCVKESSQLSGGA